jgi:hypothetical protein
VTTILGVTVLWPAILAHTGATVLVTTNAMRLLGPAVGCKAVALASGRDPRRRRRLHDADAPGGTAHWALVQLRASYPANEDRNR